MQKKMKSEYVPPRIATVASEVEVGATGSGDIIGSGIQMQTSTANFETDTWDGNSSGGYTSPFAERSWTASN